MNILGEETNRERKERLVAEAIQKLHAELQEDARQTKFELAGWDHKREYRRLRDMAAHALKLAKRHTCYFVKEER